jgi:hypothetical protein
LRGTATITVVVWALAMLTASVAMAGGKSNKNAETPDIVQIFDAEGDSVEPWEPEGDIRGAVELTRRTDGLTATANATGLTPRRVNTFWWTLPSSTHPFGSYVALGGSRVIGSSGEATVRMNADFGDPSVEGSGEYLGMPGASGTDPFQPVFDFGTLTGRVHVEIAYHRQKESAGDDIGMWRSDFWTGSACPAIGSQNSSQPHCPVSYIAESLPAAP